MARRATIFNNDVIRRNFLPRKQMSAAPRIFEPAANQQEHYSLEALCMAFVGHMALPKGNKKYRDFKMWEMHAGQTF